MPVALYLPRADLALRQWSQNVVSLITPDPAAWGLVEADVTSYTAVHAAFSTGLAACDPAVRNKAAVVAKNTARASLENGASLLANKIYSAQTVTDAQKTQIGMPPRAARTVIPPPASCPVIEVLSTSGWTLRVRLRDSSGARRGKPPGTHGALIFSYVGEHPPTGIAGWTFEGSTGRVEKIDLTFPSTLAPGTKVWVCAFWFNGRKQSGAPCPGVSANLPGGSVSMAA